MHFERSEHPYTTYQDIDRDHQWVATIVLEPLILRTETFPDECQSNYARNQIQGNDIRIWSVVGVRSIE